MKPVVYTIVNDRYYYPVGTTIFINSFKKWHPDIPLVVFRQDMIDKIFKEKKLDFYNAKPSFAKLLIDKYDLIVNIDADTVITGPLDGVFEDDYDIGSVWNYNDYENSSFENITDTMYLQGGFIASRCKEFWDVWEEENKKARMYKRRENDVMNLVAYNKFPGYILKIFDKEKDYYGCKSLGREPEFYIENDMLMCREERVRAYHHARGGHLPKLDFPNMPFKEEVKLWMSYNANYGRTTTIL